MLQTKEKTLSYDLIDREALSDVLLLRLLLEHKSIKTITLGFFAHKIKATENKRTVTIMNLPELPTLTAAADVVGFVTASANSNININTISKDSDVFLRLPFPWALHEMLDQAEEQGFTQFVSWNEDGTAFKVHDTKGFADFVAPMYFKQTKYKSFQRQLHLYGFTRIGKGKLRGYRAHELFKRGHKDLCMNMKRVKSSNNSKSEVSLTKINKDDISRNSKVTKLVEVPTKVTATSVSSPCTLSSERPDEECEVLRLEEHDDDIWLNSFIDNFTTKTSSYSSTNQEGSNSTADLITVIEPTPIKDCSSDGCCSIDENDAFRVTSLFPTSSALMQDDQLIEFSSPGTSSIVGATNNAKLLLVGGADDWSQVNTVQRWNTNSLDSMLSSLVVPRAA